MSIFDSQKKSVYAWEQPLRREFPKLDPAVIPIHISMACDFLDIPEPVLRYNVNMKSMAHYTQKAHRITFPGQESSWGHNQMVVLHELAHSVHFTKWKDGISKGDQEAHGPEFMYYFILLLKKFTKVDVDAMVKLAKTTYGIRIAENLD